MTLFLGMTLKDATPATAGVIPIVQTDGSVVGLPMSAAGAAFTAGSGIDTISEKTAGAGVTIDGVKLKDSQVYTDQINEKTSAVGVTIDGLLIKDGGAVVSAGPLQFPRGNAATQIVQAFGATSSEGLQMAIVDETVSFAGNTDLFKLLTYLFPAGTQILCAQANIQAALTGGGTTAKLGLGTEADPDLFGKTSALTQNLKITTVPSWSPLSGATYLRLTGVKSDGDAGDTALTVGSVRVRIVFIAPVDLANAT